MQQLREQMEQQHGHQLNDENFQNIIMNMQLAGVHMNPHSREVTFNCNGSSFSTLDIPNELKQ